MYILSLILIQYTCGLKACVIFATELLSTQDVGFSLPLNRRRCQSIALTDLRLDRLIARARHPD